MKRRLPLMLLSRSPAQTRRIGKALGRSAHAGRTFLLIGEYGSGKTQLVKGIAAGLGVKGGTHAVTSPTFVLHNVYEGRLTLHHIDAHRLQSQHDFEAIGWPDAFSNGVTAVEWAERVFPNCAAFLRDWRGRCRPHEGGDTAAPARAVSVSPATLSQLMRLIGRCGKKRTRQTAEPDMVVVLLRHAGRRGRIITITPGGITTTRRTKVE